MTRSEPSEQASLAEFGSGGSDGRCQAIAVSTSEPCRRHTVGDTPYCPDHIEQLFETESSC
ncbi:MAG: hypothetical protein ABEJ05_00770 [Haloglomus sp.]